MKFRLLLLAFLFLLNGCATTGTNLQGNAAAVLPKNPTAEQVAEKVVKNENLPEKTLTVIRADGAKKDFFVEIADNDLTRKIGLMNRDSLAADRGMLFVFSKSGMMNFWMKNTKIPLDMVFIDDNRKISHIVSNAQPCVSDDCPLYNSKFPARYVVELAAGVAENAGLKKGDLVLW